jgi:penicillin-binding protein 1A
VPKIKDATKVVEPGDVVWASLRADDGKDKKKAKDKRLSLALEQEPDVEGALVSIEPGTGDVVALVGGYSFEKSQFNRATQARRQPGSAFKPIVYSTALDNGFTAASMVLDAPFIYTDVQTDMVWRPENFEGVFYGPTLLRTALTKSRNLVTIRVAQKIGIDKVIERAQAMGLEGEFPHNLSVSLGSVAVTPINLCQAFTTFARGGSWVRPRMVLAVKSAWDEDIYASQVETHEAVSPQTTYIITRLLKEVVRDGTGWRAKVLGRPVAGKTGTSNDEQDAWFMGFAPYLLTGVYVGFDQVAPMGKYETGSRAASPIWVQYRQACEGNYTVQDFPEPPGIVNVRIDANSGLLAGPGSDQSYFLPFKAGTQPTRAAGAPAEAGGDTAVSGEELLKQVF